MKKFNLQSDIDAAEAKIQYYHIFIRISDEKINLEDYNLFSEEIMGGMMAKIQSNADKLTEKPSEKRIEHRRKLVQDITKVVHLLIVVYKNLFKDHKQQVLTKNEVEEILIELKDIWFSIAEGSFKVNIKKKKNWEPIVHDILKFEPGNTSSYAFLSRIDSKFQLACSFFLHWIEKTDGPVEGGYSKESNERLFIEIINKLIYNSNYESINQKVLEEMGMKRKRKRTKKE
jgi:hypothetical protein